MSQTQQAPFVFDTYLSAQRMPPSTLVMDPEWFTIDLVTPIGRFLNCDVGKPRGVRNKDGTTSPPKFAVTLLFAGGTAENPIVADLYRAIAMIANAKVPSVNRPDPANPNNMLQYTGEQLLAVDPKFGGLHNPLRDGTRHWMADPDKRAIYRGGWFLNASMWPATKAGDPKEPMCFDERNIRCSPDKFYRGCYGRAMLRTKWFDQQGNRGVTFDLTGVQFAKGGEKLASFNVEGAVQGAFAGAGALPPIEPEPGTTGPNFAGPPPGAVAAPGVGPVAGFAQPQAPAGYVPPAAAAPNYVPSAAAAPNYVPPAQPAQPPAGARPPGV